MIGNGAHGRARHRQATLVDVPIFASMIALRAANQAARWSNLAAQYRPDRRPHEALRPVHRESHGLAVADPTALGIGAARPALPTGVRDGRPTADRPPAC